MDRRTHKLHKNKSTQYPIWVQAEIFFYPIFSTSLKMEWASKVSSLSFVWIIPYQFCWYLFSFSFFFIFVFPAVVSKYVDYELLCQQSQNHFQRNWPFYNDKIFETTKWDPNFVSYLVQRWSNTYFCLRLWLIS